MKRADEVIRTKKMYNNVFVFVKNKPAFQSTMFRMEVVGLIHPWKMFMFFFQHNTQEMLFFLTTSLWGVLKYCTMSDFESNVQRIAQGSRLSKRHRPVHRTAHEKPQPLREKTTKVFSDASDTRTICTLCGQKVYFSGILDLDWMNQKKKYCFVM